MSRTIRIDGEVYARLLGLRAKLEAVTGRACTLSQALRFFLAMRGEG